MQDGVVPLLKVKSVRRRPTDVDVIHNNKSGKRLDILPRCVVKSKYTTLPFDLERSF
jgi:hypothetical protein